MTELVLESDAIQAFFDAEQTELVLELSVEQLVAEQEVTELVIEDEVVQDLVVEVAGPQGVPGPTGPPGPVGAPLVYVQATPSASWVIVHGLGRTPGVTLVVDGRVEYTEITYPDLNTALVTWPQATAGRAELF